MDFLEKRLNRINIESKKNCLYHFGIVHDSLNEEEMDVALRQIIFDGTGFCDKMDFHLFCAVLGIDEGKLEDSISVTVC